MTTILSKHCLPPSIPLSTRMLPPISCPAALWCFSQARSGGARVHTTLLASSPNPSCAIHWSRFLKRLRGEEDRAPGPERILELKVCDPAMGSGAFLVETCRQLGDALVEAWQVHDAMPEVPEDENEVIFARRQVAQRCLYGVDRNPTAVDLAKLSLWLVTLAKDHPLTFLDHALRHGDALVGLSRKQIEAFHWKGSAPQFQEGIETTKAREHLAKASQLRQRIREADENVLDSELRYLWDEAKFEAGQVAFLGDLTLAAFFDGAKPTGSGKIARSICRRGDVE